MSTAQNVMFPALVAAAGTELPPQMTADHDTMLRELDVVSRLEADFAKAKGDAPALRKLGIRLRDQWDNIYVSAVVFCCCTPK